MENYLIGLPDIYILSQLKSISFSYRFVASPIVCATLLKKEMRELFNGVYEEESTEDKNLGQIQSSFGKEAVSFLMSENKETKCMLIISF